MLTVSVIIPTYNYSRYVGHAIDSVLAQTLPVHEIIVVDDGSTDDTESVLAPYRDKVRVIHQQNRGVAAARNAGVANSSGELVAFLDADDMWLPTKIERQVARLLAEPEIAMVHCGMREVDPAGKTVSTYTQGQDGWIADELLLLERGAVVGPGSTALVRRSAFDAIDGFDEEKDLHPSEDWEFSYRLARRYKIGFIPELLVNYRNHGVNGHLNIKRMERGMLIAFEKAFADPDPVLQNLRRRCYGNLHTILAGSYFRAGNYFAFARHMLKSSWRRPGNIFYFLQFPLRSVQRFATRAESQRDENVSAKAR